ncbi:hypothetical protein L7F22_055710 [Adiantum nelumboides]|nr:hypothetical protein [Adiantum nelumboides]
MSPWQRKLRRAIGSVKDQTTISLAKVAGAIAPELEVSLVKATSHDKCPVEEKHVQEVIFLSSTSRAYTMACVTHLSRRLSRTQNWIVAVKTLMLIHRLLREGDCFFQDELFRESRAGGHILNLSGFQDDSVSCGWEYSAFVRTYALYLDELLDYNASNRAGVLPADLGRLSSSSSSSYSRKSGSDVYGSVNEEQGLGWLNIAFKDMKPQVLLEKMPPVQRMLERVLACHPAGPARMDRLVQNALDCIVRDSFHFYDAVSDGLAILLDAFFEMEVAECTRAFEIQTLAAKQAEALTAFYGFCKNILGCHLSEYPFVQKFPEELLETMEGYLIKLVIKADVRKQETGVKPFLALPAPPGHPFISTCVQIVDLEGQVLEPSLCDDMHAAKDQKNTSSVAPLVPLNDSTWQVFDDSELQKLLQRESGEENVANGWEPSLQASLNNHTPLLVNSLVTGGDASALCYGGLQPRLPLSFSLDRLGSSITHKYQPPSLLALPAPNSPPKEDPFVASSLIPPPSYVQMSDMKQQQVFLMQEQMLWDQYQRKSPQG